MWQVFTRILPTGLFGRLYDALFKVEDNQVEAHDVSLHFVPPDILNPPASKKSSATPNANLLVVHIGGSADNRRLHGCFGSRLRFGKY
jgi:hypothetical protein